MVFESCRIETSHFTLAGKIHLVIFGVNSNCLVVEGICGDLRKGGDIAGGRVDAGNHLRLVHPYLAGTVYGYLRDIVIGQTVRRIVFFKIPGFRRKTLNQPQSQRNPDISTFVYLQLRGIIAGDAVGVALLVHEPLHLARTFVHGVQPVLRSANPDLVAGIHGDAGQQVGRQAAWFRRVVFPLFKRGGNTGADIEGILGQAVQPVAPGCKPQVAVVVYGGTGGFRDGRFPGISQPDGPGTPG